MRVEEALDRGPELGPYRLLSVLGRGGMATVYRALDLRLGREVALKLLLPHLRRDRTAMKRFVQEARAVAKLRHEGIVAIFDVSAEEAVEPYLVVELVRGNSLREALRSGRAMVPEIAAEIVLDVLSALDHAHAAGMVHRDVKPENVLLEWGQRGEAGVRVKLADFGIAKFVGQQTVTSTGDLVGSPAYMAPEQLEGAAFDARADVFAVGVLFYECVTGRRPFEGEGAAQVIRQIISGQFAPAEETLPAVGSRWSQVIAKALTHDPSDRFSSASAMGDALREERRRTTNDGISYLEAWLRDANAANTLASDAARGALLVLARRATSAEDPVARAADLNRLLAISPADPEVLSLLMHRRRRDQWRHAVRIVAAGVALVLASVFLVTWEPAHTAAEGAATSVRVASAPLPDVPTDAPDSPAPVAAAEGTSAPNAPIPAAASPVPEVPTLTVREGLKGQRLLPPVDKNHQEIGKERRVFIESLQPPFGVSVRIDDGDTVPVSEGATLVLGAGKHKLHFACKSDACIPHEEMLRGPETGTRLRIALRIRAARLRILAAPDRHFQLLELPGVQLRLSDDTEVPMSGSRTTVHLVDTASGKKTSVMLTAGVVTTVSPE